MSKKLLYLILGWIGSSIAVLLMNDESSVRSVLIWQCICIPIIAGVFWYERKSGTR